MPDYFQFHSAMTQVLPPAICIILWLATAAMVVRGYRRIRAALTLDRQIKETWRRAPGFILSLSFQVRDSIAANTHGVPSGIAVTYRYEATEDMDVEHQAAAPLLCNEDLPRLAEAARSDEPISVYVDPAEPKRGYISPSSRAAQVAYINAEMKLPLQLGLMSVALTFAAFL